MSKLDREARRRIARAMLYKAYDLVRNAKRAKDLSRAFCDLLPYALKWLEDPDDVPALYQESISDVMPDRELEDLCIKALELKAGYRVAGLDGLRDRGLKYLSRFKPERFKEDYRWLKKSMRKWEKPFKKPVEVAF